MDNDAIDFYFDFSSPYGYFGALSIEAVAARCSRAVNWHPYMMGAVMKLTGARPLVAVPLVRDYAARDLARCAREHDIPFSVPDPFPVSALAPTRMFYVLHDEDAGKARDFALAVFRAFFGDGRNISEVAVSADIGARLGHDSDRLARAAGDPAVKQRVKDETQAAIDRGVFGSPFFIADGEPFWGNDRLDQLERWLLGGGW